MVLISPKYFVVYKNWKSKVYYEKYNESKTTYYFEKYFKYWKQK